MDVGEGEVEDEEDVGEGVLGLGSASEQTRGGTEVLWVDGGEAGAVAVATSGRETAMS